MRKLTWIAIILAALYSGYWFVATSALKSGTKNFLEAARNDGLDIQFETLTTAGFPSRFDTTFVNPVVRDRRSGLEWRGDRLSFYALSYKPNHLIAIAPNSQHIAGLGRNIDITSKDLRASLVLAPNTSLEIERATATGEEIDVGIDMGLGNNLHLRSRDALIALRAAETAPNTYDLAIALQQFSPPVIGAPTADHLDLEAQFLLEAPLTANGSGRLIELTLTHLRPRWGNVDVTLSGQLSFDQFGYANGTLVLASNDWAQGFDHLVASGVIAPENAPSFKQAIAALTKTMGTGAALDAELTVTHGNISMGFVPLGFIPPL